MTDSIAAAPPSTGRVKIIDTARAVALVAMASYHLCWDLENFGYLETGITTHGLLKDYARGIAGSFLFLVGLSLVLAHGRGIRWNGFWKRLAMVVGAAALFIGIIYGWMSNRGDPSSLREAEEATHRQKETHSGPRDEA